MVDTTATTVVDTLRLVEEAIVVGASEEDLEDMHHIKEEQNPKHTETG